MTSPYQYSGSIGGNDLKIEDSGQVWDYGGKSYWDVSDFGNDFKRGFSDAFMWMSNLGGKGVGTIVKSAADGLGTENTIIVGTLLAGSAVVVLMIVMKAYRII